MKSIIVILENISNGNIRATVRHDGRALVSKDGLPENAKALLAEVMAETCGAHRVGDEYDMTYIGLNAAAAEVFRAARCSDPLGQAVTEQLYPKSKLDIFCEVYVKHLADCVREFPTDYCWPKSVTVEMVMARMRPAIEKGTFSKESPAFKRTCKELGINHTYVGIKAYISEVE